MAPLSSNGIRASDVTPASFCPLPFFAAPSLIRAPLDYRELLSYCWLCSLVTFALLLTLEDSVQVSLPEENPK